LFLHPGLSKFSGAFFCYYHETLSPGWLLYARSLQRFFALARRPLVLTQLIGGTCIYMKNIIFFGDSLTAGYALPAADSFPARIQEKLNSAGLPYRALNYGVSGETSAGGRLRLPTVLARQAPDVFVLALGANDGLRGIPVRETVANLRYILTEVRRQFPEAQLVLAGLQVPFDLGPLGVPSLTRYAQEFNDLFSKLATEEGVAFIPSLLAGVLGRPSLNLPDRVHPNAAGQRILAGNVWAVLEPLLQVPA
jgi:acyl-CoA thioesterase-1